MRAEARYPTPHPEVNALLQTLLSGAQAILGNQLIGVYLHGSLASGDFDPERSDIDFLAVTAHELPPKMVAALQAMHAQIAASGLKWATNYEGSYIPLRALRCYDPADSVHPAIGVDGRFGMEGHGSDWVIQRHLIREQGIVLAGPAPDTLIDPVSPTDLRRAVLGTLLAWWAPQLHDPFRLKSSEYQAYAILTMCRALYTLQFGTVVSKPVAARWAQERLAEPWPGVIEGARAWRHGAPSDRFSEALGFIRYTVERSQQLAIPATGTE